MTVYKEAVEARRRRRRRSQDFWVWADAVLGSFKQVLVLVFQVATWVCMYHHSCVYLP